MWTIAFLVAATSLLAPSWALKGDPCGDGTTNFRTHQFQMSENDNAMALFRTPTDTVPTKWVVNVSAPTTNLSISLNETGTTLLGPRCRPTPPYFAGVSTLVIRTFVDAITHYDVRVCPGQFDTRSYVSTNRVEIYQCSPTANDTFLFDIASKIAGTRRAPSSDRAVEVKRSNLEQWVNLETANSGIVVKLEKIRVRVGTNRRCRSGYIKVTDFYTGQSVLPNGLGQICNKSDGTIRTHYLVVAKSQAVKVLFRNAKFTMVYRSAPMEEINQILATTVPDTASTTPSSSLVQDPRNVPEQPGHVDTTGGSNGDGQGNVGLYEAVGLGCAAAVVLIAVVVGYVALRKRRRNSQRRMSSKPNDNEQPVYMERPEQQSSGGVRSIDNLMYEKIVKGGGESRPRAPTGGTESLTSNDPLLGSGAELRTRDRSETEKRRQRLSQLEDVYLGLEQNKADQRKTPPSMPLHTGGDPPVTPIFHNDRPPLPPPPEPTSPHYYARIEEHEEEIPSVSYATVTKLNNNKDKKAKTQKGSEPTYNGAVRPPVALYVSSDELQQVAPSISLTPSEEYLDRRKRSLPPVDNDGYLSLTSSENLHASVHTDKRADVDRSYVQANSVSQEDVRKHFACRKRMATPGIDKSAATSMPELVHKKRQVSRPGFPPSKQHSDRLRPPQPSTKHYRQPRPSAPDIFIQSAYTSGEDLSHIRAHLERVAAQARRQNSGPEGSDLSSRTDESGGSYYDSPRPSIDSSQDSLLDGRGRQNFYDAPRPSLPCIFPEDLHKFVGSSENLRK